MKVLSRKYWILLFLTLAIIISDQITKLMVIDRFHLGESIQVIDGLFSLTYVRNTGAAFGIMAQADPSFRVPFFLIVPLIALATIIFIFRKLPDQDVKLSAALSLVMGGAVGNLIDRARLGYVVDFFDFYWKTHHFPAFNIADSAICVGVGLMLLDLFKQPDQKPGRKHAPASR